MRVDWWIFAIWHSTRCLARKPTSLRTLCLTNFDVTNFCDDLTDRYDKLSIISKMSSERKRNHGAGLAEADVIGFLGFSCLAESYTMELEVGLDHAVNYDFRIFTQGRSHSVWVAAIRHWERASATTLLFPATCFTSVVYAEMALKWRCCLPDQGCFVLLKAKVKVLWSMYTAKTQPSKRYLKWRITRWRVSNLRSKALYFCSGCLSLLKKAKDFKIPPIHYSSTL